ncbi:MAG TPA: RNA methyltransferase [Candidatus Rubrimentiphilum sp.]|nr:RNA methyltransferase [Candidatus Rubrimentiphilum sp.]
MLGAHSPKLDRVRDLRTKKGRREHGRFAIEGATLLREALRSGVSIEALYGTPAALESSESAREAEAAGADVYRLDERTMHRLSDLETAPGLLAVVPIELHPVSELFSAPGLVLALAGLSDPGNAGTLLRAADAFGVSAVVFGSGTVEPHSPKVVRSAMGSLFRLKLAVADPQETAAAAEGWEITGLAAGGDPIEGLSWAPKSLLVVGQERHGLGAWTALCSRLAAIPMEGEAESLNAAVAGGIALYEASKRVQASP